MLKLGRPEGLRGLLRSLLFVFSAGFEAVWSYRCSCWLVNLRSPYQQVPAHPPSGIPPQAVVTSPTIKERDLWRPAGVSAADGRGYLTSHYGYHMTSWHMINAYTGARADFSRGANSFIAFDADVDSFVDKDKGWPVLFSGVVAVLRPGELTVTLGRLRQAGRLLIKGQPAPLTEESLKRLNRGLIAGEKVAWSTGTRAYPAEIVEIV